MRTWMLSLLLLITSVTVVPLHAQQDAHLTAGDRVIVVPDVLSVHTQPNSSSTVVTELWGGYVTRIIAVNNDTPDETWVYLEDNAYGWVRGDQDSQPTLILYTADALDQMLADANAAVEADSTGVDAYLRRGTVFLSLHQYDDAVSDYSQAIDLASEDARLFEYRGKAYLDAGRYDESITDLLQALEGGVTTAGLLNRIAVAYYFADDADNAMDYYNQAIALESGWGLPYSNRGNLLSDFNQNRDAFADYDTAFEVDPYMVTALRNRAILHRDLEEYDAALSDLALAIEIDPFYADAYRTRARLYDLVFSEYDLALADYNQAIAIDPLNPQNFSDRGSFFNLQGDTQHAINDFKQALALDPQDYNASYNLGGIYGRLGQYPEALNTYTTAITVNSSDTALLLYRAQILLALERYPEALADTQAYMTGDHREDFVVTALFVEMSIYLQVGDYAAAAQDFQFGYAIWEEFARDYAYYGQGYWVAPQRADLITDLVTQAASAPDAETFIELGSLYMEFGQWENAITAYRNALTLAPNPEIQNLVSTIESTIR